MNTLTQNEINAAVNSVRKAITRTNRTAFTNLVQSVRVITMLGEEVIAVRFQNNAGRSFHVSRKTV